MIERERERERDCLGSRAIPAREKCLDSFLSFTFALAYMPTRLKVVYNIQKERAIYLLHWGGRCVLSVKVKRRRQERNEGEAQEHTRSEK